MQRIIIKLKMWKLDNLQKCNLLTKIGSQLILVNKNYKCYRKNKKGIIETLSLELKLKQFQARIRINQLTQEISTMTLNPNL
jgi:hypothetical protein